MRTIISRVYTHPKYAKALHWVKLISITGSAQIIVQLVGLICGILVIRFLTTQEYAFYTITNTMVGTIILFSDSGIVSGVMAQGGKMWNDKAKLGAVLNTGLQLRRKFAFLSLLIVLPLLVYLLIHHGAGVITIILISLSIIPVFFASLTDSLLEIIPKLHQNILPLQKNQVFVSVARLILNTVLIIFPRTFVAMLATGLPRMFGNRKLRSIANTFIDSKAAPDSKVEKDILKDVKRILPGVLYFCFSSQINIWLISVLGSSNSIAEVGALSRLGMILNLFSAIVSTLFVPRFAKLPSNKALLLKKFFQILLIILTFSLGVITLTYLFPRQILFLLGSQYKNLSFELFLSVITSCMGLINGTIYSLSIARSYNISPVINIGVHMISQVVLILIMDLSTTRNVLIFSITDYSIIIVMFLLNYLYHLKRLS